MDKLTVLAAIREHLGEQLEALSTDELFERVAALEDNLMVARAEAEVGRRIMRQRLTAAARHIPRGWNVTYR